MKWANANAWGFELIFSLQDEAIRVTKQSELKHTKTKPCYIECNIAKEICSLFAGKQITQAPKVDLQYFQKCCVAKFKGDLTARDLLNNAV